MDTLSTRIMASLQGRSGVFFVEDALLPGETLQATRFTLATLVAEGQIVRLARGIFCKPLLEEYSNRRVLPSPYDIVAAVAKRGGLTLIPCGATAAARVGLTQGGAQELTYFSPGSTRKIGLAGGRTIRFIHRGENRLFSFMNDRMRDVSIGLRHIGEAKVGDYEREAVRVFLKGVPDDQWKEDIEKCPEWVRTIMEEAREENLRRETEREKQ